MTSITVLLGDSVGDVSLDLQFHAHVGTGEPSEVLDDVLDDLRHLLVQPGRVELDDAVEAAREFGGGGRDNASARDGDTGRGDFTGAAQSIAAERRLATRRREDPPALVGELALRGRISLDLPRRRLGPHQHTLVVERDARVGVAGAETAEAEVLTASSGSKR